MFRWRLVIWLAAISLAYATPGWAQMDAPPVLNGNPVSGEIRKAVPPASNEAALRADIAEHPNSADLVYRLALMLREENKPKESLAAYTEAAKMRRPTAGELRSVALDYVLLEDYPDAIRWLERAAAMEPNNVDVLYALGRCYYSQSQFPEAEAMYLRVLAIEPEHLKAEENLGLAYDAERQPEKAEAALRKAAAWAEKHSPNMVSNQDEWPFLDLGTFLLENDRAAEALPLLQQAAGIAPGSAVAHEKLGRALEELGKQADGVKELEMAVRLDPKNPNMHFELGHAYRRVGEDAKARAEFAASAELRKLKDGK